MKSITKCLKLDGNENNIFFKRKQKQIVKVSKTQVIEKHRAVCHITVDKPPLALCLWSPPPSLAHLLLLRPLLQPQRPPLLGAAPSLSNFLRCSDIC